MQSFQTAAVCILWSLNQNVVDIWWVQVKLKKIILRKFQISYVLQIACYSYLIKRLAIFKAALSVT